MFDAKKVQLRHRLSPASHRLYFVTKYPALDFSLLRITFDTIYYILLC